jgi:hypothetical protein
MWKCKFGWHDWTKWVDRQLRTRPTVFGVPGKWSDIQGQRRECQRCGLVVLRTLSDE